MPQNRQSSVIPCFTSRGTNKIQIPDTKLSSRAKKQTLQNNTKIVLKKKHYVTTYSLHSVGRLFLLEYTTN